MTTEKQLSELMQILKEEYGIETPEQLFAAVKQLGGIDITPLVAKPRNGQTSGGTRGTFARDF